MEKQFTNIVLQKHLKNIKKIDDNNK